ncbi:hypothetical protein EB835_03750 [Brevibacterium sp. S22]|nr:hypothetical protein EB835_03750 [Brevibacterium sp. S22]
MVFQLVVEPDSMKPPSGEGQDGARDRNEGSRRRQRRLRSLLEGMPKFMASILTNAEERCGDRSAGANALR